MRSQSRLAPGAPESTDGGGPSEPAEDGTRSATAGGNPIGRRVLLGMLGLGTVGVVAGSRIQDTLGKVLDPIRAADPTGLSSLIPGGDGFIIYTVTPGYPKVTDAGYQLVVDGLVDTPLTLSLADLKSMPATNIVGDFQCVTGWRVPGVHWTGVTLSTILNQAGLQPAGQALRFESYDGTYTESLTMAEGLRPDVMVAYSMLGGPVSTEHGGPVRMYVKPMYGYKSTKWLSRVTVVNKVEPGYWETVGDYDVEAWVGGSNGRSDPPTA